MLFPHCLLTTFLDRHVRLETMIDELVRRYTLFPNTRTRTRIQGRISVRSFLVVSFSIATANAAFTLVR